MTDYTVGDFLGQDSAEYLVTQLLLRIKEVGDVLSEITHVDVQVSNDVPTDPPAHPDTTLYVVLVSDDPEAGDLFTEYIWVVRNQAWTRVSKAQIDLSNCAKKTDIGDATLTITMRDRTLGTFTANSEIDQTIDIPADSVSEVWNDNDRVAHSKTTKANMPVAITNGTLHVAVDTSELYLDTGNNRIRISDYIILADDAARLALQNPIESKLYLVESTHCLWSYKNGRWSLLSYGDLLKRNRSISTFPVALGSNLVVDQGTSDNWLAHGTMIQVPELMYLTSDMKFSTLITQLPMILDYDIYVIPAIYKYIGFDPDDNKIKCSLVAAGNARQITKIGWQEFTFDRGTQMYLDPQEVYFYVYLHNMNGLGMPGFHGTRTNDPPYVSWISGNLGSIRDVPSTLELQSESTLRLFGSFYANGAAQT